MKASTLLVTSASGRTPRMSVMMPNYNHGHFIEEALIAISQQTMLPFEVVVVDDGSTDDSIARLQSLAPKMPWLRIHRHPENRGVVAAMNTGLALVRGDFVLGTAADDRLDREIIERAFAGVAELPSVGIVFSDQAEMSSDGSGARAMSLDLPSARRHFSASEFIRLMRRNFFYFHVSSVWFNTELLRSLGGFRPELRWHADLFAAYAAAFERGATYVPGAVSYFRRSPQSYSVGARSNAQLDVLRAWLAATREPGWEARRAAFVAAAIWPEYSLRAIPVLWSDSGYLTPRLAARIAWLAFWTKIAPLVSVRMRHWMRGIRSHYRRSRSSSG
jgi:glycosyltransferase involved in cell wall biosynthesis